MSLSVCIVVNLLIDTRGQAKVWSREKLKALAALSKEIAAFIDFEVLLSMYLMNMF